MSLGTRSGCKVCEAWGLFSVLVSSVTGSNEEALGSLSVKCVWGGGGGVECLANFKGPCDFLRSLFQIQPTSDPNAGAPGREGWCSVQLSLLWAKQIFPSLRGEEAA